MERLITAAVVAATMLTGAAHADENPKAVLFAGMMTYEKACSAKLPPVAKDCFFLHKSATTEKDMNDALDQTANALKMGIGPWCRTMTKMLKATVAE